MSESNGVRKIIKCPSIPTPLGPYSQAVAANNQLYISGVLGTDVDGNFAGEDTVTQAKKALENIGSLLDEVGLKRNNVVKCTVLLTDIKEINAMNEVYREFFKPNYPARTCFQVVALPRGGRIEIDAIAAIGNFDDQIVSRL